MQHDDDATELWADAPAARRDGAPRGDVTSPASEVAPSPEPVGSADERGPIPAFVWLVSATLSAILLLGTFLLPPLLIPDEKHHADMVLMVQEGTWRESGWPQVDERLLDPEILAASLSVGARERALRINRAAQHPPLFYVSAAVASSMLALPFDDPGLAFTIWTFRLVSVLATALLPLVIYRIAAELTSSHWIRLSSTAFVMVVPGISLRNGPMVSVDPLLLLFSSIAILYAIRVSKGDLGLQAATGLGLSTGLAVITKGHGLLLVPVAVLAYALHLARTRRWDLELVTSAMLSGAITCVVGGWWWVRNLLLYGSVQPIRDLPVSGPLTLDWTQWGSGAIGRVVAGFWGGEYALGGRSYEQLFWAMTVLFVVACIAGLARSEDRLASLVAALYMLVLVPAIFLTSAFVYTERGTVAGIQGRYLYPGIAGLAPLVAIAVAGVVGRFTRWLPTIFVVAATAMTTISVRFMLNRYWSENGTGPADQWSTVLDSTPIPGIVPVASLVLAAAGLLWLLGTAVTMGLRDDPRGPSWSPIPVDRRRPGD